MKTSIFCIGRILIASYCFFF